MQKLAENIVEIIWDYHNYDGFQFTPDHILNWVNQFEEEDREFILSEFLHLLKQGIYISETKARELLLLSIEQLAKKLGFKTVTKFLENAIFLDLQNKGKSQSVLLALLDEELRRKSHPGIQYCGSTSKKYVLYIDDILATGGSIFQHLLGWLQEQNNNGETNLDKVLDGSQVVIAYFFCTHTWGRDKFPWRLKAALKEDRIVKLVQVSSHYLIENHPKHLPQKFNFAYPVSEQPDSVIAYLAQIPPGYNEEFAYRKSNLPNPEQFYSSPNNRIRFENILLLKGIDLLGKAKALQKNHRPLGATLPSNKMFGTGTLFFTWRNISNTCPVVFWWESPHWNPLFPLFRRGIKG